jgi:xylan 1,4-beta-xylosidase
MSRNFTILFVLLYFPWLGGYSQDTLKYNSQGTNNPLVPGYFADPTIKKFGDTYYLYATTDGIKLASGPAQVWISKDFVNWYNYMMDVPMVTGLTNCWAPDVVKGKDGKYYYFHGNCQDGCNIYGYVSESPTGPWTSINSNTAIIKAGDVKGSSGGDLPALDAQYLSDNDSLYTYFGTWCTSFGGLGWAKISTDDMKTVLKKGLLPIAGLPLVFEGAYPIKKNNKYIMMYSAGDCQASSYNVRYSYSNSPTGPFTAGANNPILVTNTDGSVDGPGHHSVLFDTASNNYFIVYHRHDNPHSTGGEFRQVCADTLYFDNDSTVRKVVPTHRGVGYIGANSIPYRNLAYKAKVTASSYYNLVAKDYKYLPEYAVDDNNGTMWKAASGSFPQSLTLDLDSVVDFSRVMTQFEYTTLYYQYKIEYSQDSVTWSLFSDRTSNHSTGSPLIDDDSVSSVKARYLRITVTGAEKSGMIAAIWNVKVYSNLFEVLVPTSALKNKVLSEGPGTISTNSLLVDLEVDTLAYNTVVSGLANKGTLGGTFNKTGTPKVQWVDSVRAIYFGGASYLKLSVIAPDNLNWNSAYTASTWVYNPSALSSSAGAECLLVWDSRDNMLMSSYAALMYGSNSYGAVAHGAGYADIAYSQMPTVKKWHNITVTFDGMYEKIYVDGVINNQQELNLFVQNSSIIVAASGNTAENFSGYISSARLYDYALTGQAVIDSMAATEPPKVAGPPVTGVKTIKNTEKAFNIFYSTVDDKIIVKNQSSELMDCVKLVNLVGIVITNKKDLEYSETEINAPQKGIYIVVIENKGKRVATQKVVVY